MTKFNRFYVCLLFTSLFIAHTPTAQADMQQQGYGSQVGETEPIRLPPARAIRQGNQAMVKKSAIRH